MVLQTVNTLAPAFTAASAISTMLGTLGDNLTITGSLYSATTAVTTLVTKAASWLNILPVSVFGQLRFNSRASDPDFDTS